MTVGSEGGGRQGGEVREEYECLGGARLQLFENCLCRGGSDVGA